VNFPNIKNAMSYFLHYESNLVARSLAYWIGCAIGFLTIDKIENFDHDGQLTVIQSFSVIGQLKANRWNFAKQAVAAGIMIGLFLAYVFYFKLDLGNTDPEWAQAIWVVFAGVLFMGSLFYCILKNMEIFPQMKFSLGSRALFNVVAKLTYPIALFHILWAISKSWNSAVITNWCWYTYGAKCAIEYIGGILVSFGLVMLIDLPLKNLWEVWVEGIAGSKPVRQEVKLSSIGYPRNYSDYKEKKWSLASTRISNSKRSDLSNRLSKRE
jgi:hypothetical protein